MYDDQRGVLRNISIQDEHAFLAAVHAPDLMVVLDTAGTVLWVSPSHREMLGYNPVGRRNVDLFHPDDRDTVATAFARRVSTRSPSTIDVRLLRDDGEVIEVESTGVPIVSHDGRVEHVVVTARSLSERRALERRMSAIFEQLPANVWTTDRDLNITSSAGGGLSIIGMRHEAVVGRNLREYLANDPLRDLALELHERVLRGETFSSQMRWRDRDLHVRAYPLHEGGEIAGVIGISFDVTDQRRAERRYQALFERNVAGVFRATVSGRLLECNEAFARIFGHDSAAEMLKYPTPSLYFNATDRDELIQLLRDSGTALNYEVRLRRKDGEPVWALINEKVSPPEDGVGEEVLEGTLIDITARKLAEAQMEYQAFHDALTDLPNRTLFNDRLALALAQAQRHARSVAVLFLDLDEFKLINDTMAHSAGDELLRSVASRLLASLRSEDTVARIGGDEFVFILPDMDQPGAAAGAARVAEKVLEAIRQPFVIQSRELYVTASIGIAISPHDGDDAETLIKNADSAMYRAKEAGRNNYQFHTPMAQRRAEMRLTMETALRHAVSREEFFLLYQPTIDLRSGAIAGLEALIRWNRPGFGVIPPREFVPLAEEIGIIIEIGEWVLWTACRQMRQWLQAGAPNLRLAVNLSTRQFHDDQLVSTVEDVLASTELDPRSLELEITESLSMRDSDLTIRRLSDFRAKGIGVSLDDFGTGYSSLSHLRYLPLTGLKIDHSFVDGLRETSAERTIVGAIVAMGHSLGLRVVAEGVETDLQQRILSELACDEVQGFLHSQPLAPGAVARLLKL